MTERISKAIDIFLDAVNNNTLAKGNCVACAVGNLVAHGLDGKITLNSNRSYFECSANNSSWAEAFFTVNRDQTVVTEYLDHSNVIINIEATDFTIEELMAIEYAFETNTRIHFSSYGNFDPEDIRKDQIRGLEAVVNVMMTFDDVEADVKEVFTNKLEPVV